MDKNDLEERLIDFSVAILKITQKIPETKSVNYLSGQLIRSGTAPALNYGEARSGESRKDFIHKMQIALKELRETNICLRIIDRANMFGSELKLTDIIQESNELISIFVKSIQTANRNLSLEKEN